MRRLAVPLLIVAGLAGLGASADRTAERILSPADLQQTDAPGGESPRVGETVVVVGVVVAASPVQRLWYLGTSAGGPWSGVKVEGRSVDRRPGERVMVTGTVVESAGETRVEASSVRALGSDALPEPTVVDAAALVADGERWEGVLVRVDDLRVEGETSQYGEYPVSGEDGGTFLVDDEFITSYIADPGDRFGSMTGLVAYGFGSFRLEPRGDDDLAGWMPGRVFDAELGVVVHDGAGEVLPARVTLYPASGTPLRLGPDDRAEGSEDSAFLPPGGGTVRVPSGTYDVVVTRGLEYGVYRERVVVPSGGRAEVAATLAREVDSTGWISGDFHLHAQPSFDTPLPVPGRVLSLAAEGVEWAIATDHNAVTDYAPVVESLGLGAWITTSIGDEITTRSPNYGHFNAWPLEPGSEPSAYRSVTPAELFAAARSGPFDEIVQVNHPSIPDQGSQYFDVYQVDRWTGEPAVPGFSFDFDAVEVFNGRYLDQGLLTLETWLRMRNAGHAVTLTGNSDSHHLVFAEPGYPRNYVASPTDDPAQAREEDLVAAVRAGRVFVTYGPLLGFTANGAGLGETVALDGEGAVALAARVQWASWMTPTTATVRANGRTLGTLPLPEAAEGEPGDAVLEWTDRPLIDTEYVLVVDGTGSLEPVRRGSDFRPVAVTNPVRVDADGDGTFSPPGNVADATTVGDLDRVDASGVPERLGEWVSVEGTATTDTGFLDPSTGSFYLDDGTGGIQVREAPGPVTPVVRGDRVWVGGFVFQVLGETVLGDALVERRGAGAPVESESATTGAIAAGAEALEGRVVRITGANVTGGSWPEGGAEGSVVLDDGSGGVPLVIRSGLVVPPEAGDLADFTLTALVTQRDFSPPYTSGYRLTLRAVDDLFPGAVGAGPGSALDDGRVLGTPRPNPFRASLAIPVRAPRDGPAPVVEIVDVTGRLVRTLRAAPGERGTLTWDGRDAGGREVASGVYFARLKAGTDVRVHRVVKLR